MTNRLNNFGYAQLEMTKTGKKIPKGVKINCHEFHKSIVNIEEEKILKLSKQIYDGSIKTWECGYQKNNTLGGYPHVHFMGNTKFLEGLIKCNIKKKATV